MVKKKYFQKKDSWEGKIFLIFLGIFLFSIIVFLIFSNYRITKKRIELQGQIKNLQNQIRELEEKKAKLESALSSSDNPEFLEKEARDRLGLKKPGEEVIVILPPKKEQATSTVQKKSFWQNLLEKFGF